jgi:hypothetical protein
MPRSSRAGSIDRPAHARRAIALFNGGDFWTAHEELETIWRSLPDGCEARVVQGLIQAAAALHHRERGNRHGVVVVGERALGKLAGAQHPAVEFETETFCRELERALHRGGPAPELQLREP